MEGTKSKGRLLSKSVISLLFSESFVSFPVKIEYKNSNQVKLSGVCYRSKDPNAIDFEYVELGAQHIGV